MSALTWVDSAVCVSYLSIVLILGLWCARKQHTNEDYFVGGRRMNWIAVGLSIFAATISSLSFVGLPREAAYNDYHLLLAILFIPFVVTPIVCWLFAPLYVRLGVTSAYEYLELRFHRSVRLLASTLYSLYTVGWIGNMLVAVGVILQAVLGLTESQFTWTLIGVGLFATLYTTVGGAKAVVWTDVLQALTLGGGMLTVLVLAVDRVDGGWATVWAVGNRYDKFQMFDLRWNLTEANFYSACAFGFFVYLTGLAVSQGSVQRFVSVPGVAEARWSLIVNGVMTGAVCALFFVVGSVLFVFYHQSLPPGAPAGGGFPDLPREDQLMPHFILTVIARPGLIGLLLAGLFAAAMSSVDSGINNLTALVVCDWLSGRRLRVGFSRVLCGSFGVAVILAALLIRELGGHVFDMVMAIAGTFFGPLLGVFLLGMAVKRANAVGALSGMLAGMACVIWVILETDISHWWYGAFGCVPTLVVGLSVSLLAPPPPARKTRGLLLYSDETDD